MDWGGTTFFGTINFSWHGGDGGAFLSGVE